MIIFSECDLPHLEAKNNGALVWLLCLQRWSLEQRSTKPADSVANHCRETLRLDVVSFSYILLNANILTKASFEYCKPNYLVQLNHYKQCVNNCVMNKNIIINTTPAANLVMISDPILFCKALNCKCCICLVTGSAARDPHGIKQITVGPPHGIKQITMFIRENVECLDSSFTTTTTIKVNNCTLIFHYRKL
ncbi:hypothetical protein J6590_042309 [Homalodisca vitripennis]|nr:hypothetical protein J6590_042309 [Homalodisca vitripennis]